MSPEMKQKLREIVLKHQDYKQFPFVDKDQDLKVGFSHNLMQRGVTLDQAFEFLNDDLNYYIAKLNKYVSHFSELSDTRQIVLVALCHFIGWQHVIAQTDLTSAIERADYTAASLELLKLEYDDLSYMMQSDNY